MALELSGALGCWALSCRLSFLSLMAFVLFFSCHLLCKNPQSSLLGK